MGVPSRRPADPAVWNTQPQFKAAERMRTFEFLLPGALHYLHAEAFHIFETDYFFEVQVVFQVGC